MPTREEVNYFGAGPAAMPTPVLEEAAKVLLNYHDMGIGVAEMSHRSSEAKQILVDAKASLSRLLTIPDDYEILFSQGGGSGQFSAVVYHMVGIWVEKQRLLFEKMHGTKLDVVKGEVFQRFRDVVEKHLRLDYLVTGSWSLKASQEAGRLLGSKHVHIVVDSRDHHDGKFGVIPAEDSWELNMHADESMENHAMRPAFTYLCDNETVDSTEYAAFPTVLESSSGEEDRLVVADMSSNILSKQVDVRKYAVIFAGAQKNIGTTGITIIIVRKSLLPPQSNVASPELMRGLGLPLGPIALDWSTIAKNDSLYNTLPIFDVWIAGQVMKRMVDKYGAEGIARQERISNDKAALIYQVLDAFPQVYQVVAQKPARSRMNICFRISTGNKNLEDEFLAGAEKRCLTGLKGHRSVGGIRISNYNAVSMKAVEKVIDYLKEFAHAQT